jgi:putative transposase
MARKRHTAEEIVAKLRQADVLMAQGRQVADAVRAIGVTEVTYYLYGRLSRCKSIFDLICLASRPSDSAAE